MLVSSIRKNIKSILRDPTTILAILVAIITQFMYGLDFYEAINQYDVHGGFYVTSIFNYAMNTMMNAIAKPVFEVSFPFLGVIIAVDIFKDKRTSIFEVLSTSQLSFRTYYIAKIITYYFIGLCTSLVLGLGFEALYLIVYHPFHWEINWLWMLKSQLVWMFALYTSCLWIPIAVAVFFSAVTGIPAVGMLANCFYYYMPWMISFYYDSWAHKFLHVVPEKLWIFLKYWVVEPYDWYEVTIGSAWMQSLGIYSSFKESIISYCSIILIAVSLFTASYFLLKKRFQKA